MTKRNKRDTPTHRTSLERSKKAGELPATVHDRDRGFPIVGIGASAGGLNAFQSFFSAMPTGTPTGMAFVLVQHLAPDQKSLLVDLIKYHTHMEVLEIQDKVKVQREFVYVIPPDRDLALKDGSLRLTKPSAQRGFRLPVDFFFRSLAQQQRERAICVVLSGTGSDGTLGLREVKGQGGLAIVQQPESAEYDGMPRSAIATGLVDWILPPQDIPAKLATYTQHAFGCELGERLTPAAGDDDTLEEILVQLHTQTGHDFSQYKRNTILRRVQRRMALNQIERPNDYLRYLCDNPQENHHLFHDLLIGVTSFFRDPASFAALQEKVISRLVTEKKAGGTVRIWVCGCSTGEEAFSIAILLRECLENQMKRLNVQVFATDLDGEAIERARRAVFPANIANDISAERLVRFFEQEPENGFYRLNKSIRDLVIFSVQDVYKDPPFSRLDLISCRNLLIYMNGNLQKKIIPLFHYALNPNGVLFLGSSETVGEFATFFSAVDRRHKLYRLLPETAASVSLRATADLSRRSQVRTPIQVNFDNQENSIKVRIRAIMERALLQHYVKAAVLVDARGEILHIYGRTGRYLEPTPGEASLNILQMARQGLHRELAIALRRASGQREPVICKGLEVLTNGDTAFVNLIIKPVNNRTDEQPSRQLYLVLLEEQPLSKISSSTGTRKAPSDDAKPGEQLKDTSSRLAELEQALRAKEEYLQTTIEEMETSNEELKSTNEELQSVNEELQSTNEEMETSKEELQSVNEELSTVNAELQNKLADLSRANNDMSNLLAGTGVATLFVDHQLRIARFTPATTDVINLISTDVGRPVAHIVSNLVGYNRLVEDIQTVLDDLVPQETEVQTRAGTWYQMRIRPYRTLENVIEGVVLTFVDITTLKRAQRALVEARDYAQSIVATVREPLIVLNEALRVISANRSFYRVFGASPKETEGRLLYDLGDGQWNIPRLRELLEEILPQQSTLEDFEVTCDFPGIGKRTMLLNGRRICQESSEENLILLAIEDTTERASRTDNLALNVQSENKNAIEELGGKND